MAEKVSVLFAVPAGNAYVQLTEATRQSIVSQTYPQTLLEVIEVQYAASAPGGQSAAFNAAREVATGAYIVHAEPGIVWDNHKIERQVTQLQNVLNVAGCVHAMTRRVGNGHSVPMRLDMLRHYGLRIGSFLASPWGPGALLVGKDVSDKLGAYRLLDHALWEFAVRLIGRSYPLFLMDEDLSIWRVPGVYRNRQVLTPSGVRHPFLKPYLDRTDIGTLFQNTPLISEPYGQLVRGALYLKNDDLAVSHAIFQQVGRDERSATTCYWHGIVHRREPDFNNARGWFQKAEGLVAGPVLNQAICTLLQQAIQMPDYGKARDVALVFLRHLKNRETWDGLYFLNLCQRCNNENDEALQRLLEDIQEKEFEVLFDWTFRQAIGKAE